MCADSQEDEAIAFVDNLCQHENGTLEGCLQPGVRAVGSEWLCQGHATLADLRRAGTGRPTP